MKIKSQPQKSPLAKQIGLYLAIGLLTNSAYANIKSHSDRNQQEVILDTTVVWQSPASAPELYSENHYTPLWHYNGSTYFVWVNDSYRAMVTKIKDGVAQTVPLDPNSDYKITQNGHNRFSMGIDNKGYIHITGDMQNYTTTTSTGTYPVRYQQQSILYWKSANPEDVEAGFNFVGGKDAPTAPPGIGYSYGRFFTDNNNDLYYSARVKGILGPRISGEMAMAVYRYDANAQVWTALGGKPEESRPGTYYDVLVWENAGMAPNTWYQGFLNTLKFDAQNRLHMGISINTDSSLVGNDRLIYAYSNDQGASWFNVGARRLQPLPIRGRDGLANQGSVVASTITPPYFDSRVKTLADKNGKPAVLNRNLYTWNGDRAGWVINNNFFLANTMDIDKDGNLILTASGLATMMHANSYDSKAYGYEFRGYNLYESVDEYSLRRTGDLYGVGINLADKTQSILKTTFTPAPLPSGWHSQDIAANAPTYAGTAGFLKGKFVVNDYGVSIDNPHDSMHYVYKTMRGDGYIVARVDVDGSSNNARAGVMMRESLAFNSIDVFELLAPGRTSAVFGRRTVIAGHTTNTFIPNVTGQAWVKLVRKGNVFTGFHSVDGDTWVQSGTVTVAMPEKIYVGLASASYNRTSMLKTTYDMVSVPLTFKKIKTLKTSG